MTTCRYGHEMTPENTKVVVQWNPLHTRKYLGDRCIACANVHAQRSKENAVAREEKRLAELDAALRFSHDRSGGRRCEDCELMLDFRTPRQIREGLPADPHVCIDRSTPMSAGRDNDAIVEGHGGRQA